MGGAPTSEADCIIDGAVAPILPILPTLAESPSVVSATGAQPYRTPVGVFVFMLDEQAAVPGLQALPDQRPPA